MIDASIRGQFEEIKRNISSLHQTEKAKAKQLTQNEVNRRLNIIQEIENNIEKMKKSYESLIISSLKQKNKNNTDNFENNQNDNNAYNELTPAEILKLQQDKIKGNILK